MKAVSIPIIALAIISWLSSQAIASPIDAKFTSCLDVTYETVDGHPVALDLYRDPTINRPAPLIVYIHGGGWIGRTKSDGLFYANAFLKKGYVFATLDYRLAPDAVFPAQIEDVKAAIRFLRAHAADYHIDPNHIGVMGHSAGGHLAALLGTTNGDAEFNVGDNLSVSDSVQAVCDMSGPVDLTVPAPALNPLILKLLGAPVDQKLDLAKKGSPIDRVSPASVPFLILHGEKDPVVPLAEAQDFTLALQKAGVPVQLIILPGQPHNLNIWARTSDGSYLDLIFRFFDTNLRK